MATGTALNVASLAIQLSGCCLQGYSSLVSGFAASHDALSLALQFDIEQARFNDFRRAVGIDNEHDKPSSYATIIATPVLIYVLHEIDLTLQRVVRCELLPEPLRGDYGNPTTLDTNANLDVHALLAELQQRQRPSKIQSFRWDVTQKRKTETILQRLVRYNDYLHELLDAQQLKDLQRLQKQSFMSIVQMQSTVQEMRALSMVSNASQDLHRHSTPWQRTADLELQNLAAFKATYATLPDAEHSISTSLNISPLQIELSAACEDQPGLSCAIYHTSVGETRPVWVNWQDRRVAVNDTGSAARYALEELMLLLQVPKPGEFCILPCVGYAFIRPPREERPQAAIMFEVPAEADPVRPPRSLFDAFTRDYKPSLTYRVALAHKISQSLLYFHSVNWLHKALRSANVFFLPLASASPSTEVDLSKPYLAGFDHTRPARWNEPTNSVPRLGTMEVYRHPDTQLMGPQLPYRKTFDIYSLGLMLVEIAFWQPIVSIMHIENTVARSPTVAYSVRERWLESEPDLLRRLRAEVGDKYAEVVTCCLQGREAFAIDRRDDETSVGTGMVIQRMFSSRVVWSLNDITS